MGPFYSCSLAQPPLIKFIGICLCENSESFLKYFPLFLFECPYHISHSQGFVPNCLITLHLSKNNSVMPIVFSSSGEAITSEKVLWVDDYVSLADSGLLTPTTKSYGFKTYIP
jgi:hypothetical protein